MKATATPELCNFSVDVINVKTIIWMQITMPQTESYVVFYKIPTYHKWQIQSLGNTVLSARFRVYSYVVPTPCLLTQSKFVMLLHAIKWLCGFGIPVSSTLNSISNGLKVFRDFAASFFSCIVLSSIYSISFQFSKTYANLLSCPACTLTK